MNKEELYKKINDILWEEWDPINLNKDPEWPKDEYESYVPQIYTLLSNGADEKVIGSVLNKIADKTMGMAEPREHSTGIAAKIIALKD